MNIAKDAFIIPDEEKNKMEEFNKKLSEANKAGKCDLPRIFCYRGYCRSKNYAIYDNESKLKFLDKTK
jgi:hypothetical protein